jgi:hypothetical protein
MRKVQIVILIIVGLINLYPLVGVISSEQLMQLYGVQIETKELFILMRHRAILFGLLGAFILFSAFKDSLQLLACIAGLVSMLSFVMLAYVTGDYGDAIQKIVMIDVIGSIGLIVVLWIRVWKPGTDT